VPEGDSERKRKSLPKALQVAVFRRDGWLCCWCKKPVIFSPAMRFLELELRNAGHTAPLAYYHRKGTRQGSPLLDELAASIDHVEAFSTGGPSDEENLRTSCWKCNTRKNSMPLAEWDRRHKHKPVKGKYGEPQHWDGLSSMFVVLAGRFPEKLTAGEREWLRALRAPASSPKPKAVPKPKSKAEGIILKADKKTVIQRVYSSVAALQNDCRNYNWTLLQYREISAEGLAGEWIPNTENRRLRD
jgi:5-methylcytosine-specific restriction endonuclease McrA